MLLLVQYTLIFASVLVLVALGGCFSEHSGVINIGLEGIMVTGALGGALMMKYLSGDMAAPVVILLVILASVVVGMLFSLLLGVAAIRFNADQTLVGTALNLLGPAAAVVLVRALNTAENASNVSSAIAYGHVKKAFIVNIGGFEFNWFPLTKYHNSKCKETKSCYSVFKFPLTYTGCNVNKSPKSPKGS